jgi:RNA polymerase sigma-70 factor (ECF subfamily)
MRKIVVNTAIDYYRKSLKKIRTSELKDDLEHSDFSINLQQFDLNYFKNIIAKMPDGYRIIFNLYVVEGYNHREIAELTGVSEGTSKSQFSRARKHLQDIILKENNQVKEHLDYYGKSTYQLV